MSDGADVRRAYDGPDIDHDTLIGTAARHNMEDGDRASSAAETRQDIGEFIERTGMNNKAYSIIRQIMKIGDKSQDKAMDVIRSLQKGLPMVESHIGGQTTQEMPLEEPEEETGSNEMTEHDPSPEEDEFNREVDEAVKPIEFGHAAE